MHTLENRGKYLFVEVTEPIVVKVILATIQEIADMCRNENLDKVLVDMRTVRESISIIDRYTAGVNVANVIGPKIKVAVVAREDIITYVAETAAVNRYGKMKLFSDLNEAMKWLGAEG